MEFLAVLMVLLVAWLVLLSVAAGLGLWALTRHNRVSTEHSSAAPLSWVWAPSRPARMHRRLRTAVGWVDRPVAGGPAVQHDHLRVRLIEQAVDLDVQLVRIAHAPRSHRRAGLRQLSSGISEVERLAVRVHGLTRPVGVPLSGMPGASPTVEHNLVDLRHHLDLLDAAHAELTDVERQAGLGPAPDLPTPDGFAWGGADRSASASPRTTVDPAARPAVIEASVVDAKRASSMDPMRSGAAPG